MCRAFAVLAGRFSISSFRDLRLEKIVEVVQRFQLTLLVHMNSRNLENWKSKSGQQLPQTLYQERTYVLPPESCHTFYFINVFN
jgi:hypothetical protein